MYQDAQGILYVHEEAITHVAEEKKAPLWPWMVGGAVVLAGAALWMSHSTTRNENPVSSDIEQHLILEAQDPDTPWERLRALSLHESRDVRKALLQNKSICIDENGEFSLSILTTLSSEFPDETACSPCFVFHAFYGDPTPMTHIIIRIVEFTSNPDLISFMVSSFGNLHPWIQQSAASNKSTPSHLFADLANDWADEVANNPSATPEVLRVLSSTHVYSVAKNPNAPPDVLWNILMVEKSRLILSAAEENLSRRGLL